MKQVPSAAFLNCGLEQLGGFPVLLVAFENVEIGRGQGEQRRVRRTSS
jgi:hypothetical protein